MPIFIGGAIAANGLAGDLISSGGQQSANDTNMQIAQAQMAFQKQSQQQAEDYDTQMSDTAVSRRVADMKSVGLNPILAAGNPASAPVVSGQTGASIPVSNPDAAFGNLGSQIGGAVQSAIQSQSTAANVANTNADTATKLAQLPYSGASAAQQVDNLKAQQEDILASAHNMEQQFMFDRNTFATRENTLVNNADFQRQLNGLTLDAQKVNLQRAQLGLPQLQNEANFANTWWGRYIAPIFNSGGGSGASSALGTVGSFIK